MREERLIYGISLMRTQKGYFTDLLNFKKHLDRRKLPAIYVSHWQPVVVFATQNS